MTNFEFPSTWLPLADSIVKASLVLIAAALATHALRRASAALRHLIWTIALVSALLMPLLSMALPRWQFPLLTVARSETPATTADNGAIAPPFSREKKQSIPDAPAPAPSLQLSAASDGNSVWSGLKNIGVQRALFGIWAVGALLIVLRVFVGVLAVQWMSRRGHRVLDAPWMKMAVQLASEVGVSSNITFLRSRRASMPMACGVLRPAVLMPEEADEWPADRLRIVLLHELAHVKRHDCLTHLIAQLTCAFHWFNPLAWIAARQVRTERERACDDLVLAAGTRGPDYADQLLEIARVMRAGRYPSVLAGATLAMAHRSQLEGRLMAILDPRVPHSALTRLRAAAATTVCCAAVVPLAALQPWAEASVKEPPPVLAPASRHAQQQPEAPKPAPAPTPAPAEPSAESRRQRQTRGQTESETATAVSEAVSSSMAEVSSAVAGAVTGAVHGAWAGVLGSNHHNPDWQENKSASSKADPRMVAALTAALKDTDKEVRETAMHALVQMRDPAVFEPLLQALKDASYEVREQAAFGLGQLRDKRAADALSAALKDEHPDVREQAAFALGQLRDRSAIAGLTAALKDVDADVREQAIFALGQLRDPATIDGLSTALHDANADVREQAAFALGQLRDKRAVPPLISALKDTNADVREQAAFALGQIRDASAVEALVFALRDAAADVREQAAFALGQLRDPRAIDGLTAALKDPQASVRQQAAFALGQLAR